MLKTRYSRRLVRGPGSNDLTNTLFSDPLDIKLDIEMRPEEGVCYVDPVEILPEIWVYRFTLDPDVRHVLVPVDVYLRRRYRRTSTFTEYSYVWNPYVPIKL